MSGDIPTPDTMILTVATPAGANRSVFSGVFATVEPLPFQTSFTATAPVSLFVVALVVLVELLEPHPARANSATVSRKNLLSSEKYSDFIDMFPLYHVTDMEPVSVAVIVTVDVLLFTFPSLTTRLII
jgi:hypothetical protein